MVKTPNLHGMGQSWPPYWARALRLQFQRIQSALDEIHAIARRYEPLAPLSVADEQEMDRELEGPQWRANIDGRFFMLSLHQLAIYGDHYINAARGQHPPLTSAWDALARAAPGGIQGIRNARHYLEHFDQYQVNQGNRSAQIGDSVWWGVIFWSEEGDPRYEVADQSFVLRPLLEAGVELARAMRSAANELRLSPFLP
jgi:hypothetical protein